MSTALRQEILSILAGARDMTIATVREDGYPQATTVSYANDGLSIFFGASALSQKAQNIARRDKVSLAISLPYANWGEIRGISAGGRARRLSDPEDIERAGRLLLEKFTEGVAEYASGELESIAVFQVVPEVISVLDYRKGFGHTDFIDDLTALEESVDVVQEADLESLPASDPPTWTRTTTR
jgi:nitroimidazol reductase NimA-like FMN-containing flavoprotein (pyridoxamine 5'-phosphate oxidase superfamily)